jgi:RNA polymerase sigma-70 factor (ECF subfamily)
MAHALSIADWRDFGAGNASWRTPIRLYVLHGQFRAGEDCVLDDTDAPDIAAARRGDENAYARIVTRHQHAIGAYMWRFTRDHGQWTELVHDVFVEAYFSLGGFRGDAPFLHWLRKIATRTGYRHWKQTARDRTRRELAIRELAPSTESSARRSEASERSELLHATLAELAPRDRLVLTLLHLEEMSTKDIAQVTGWSHTMVRVQAYRARAKLKALLTKRVGGEAS